MPVRRSAAGRDRLAWWLQLPLCTLGASYGFLYAPLIGVVMASVPTSVAGLPGGLISTSQQAGYGIGVAALGAAFTSPIASAWSRPSAT